MVGMTRYCNNPCGKLRWFLQVFLWKCNGVLTFQTSLDLALFWRILQWSMGIPEDCPILLQNPSSKAAALQIGHNMTHIVLIPKKKGAHEVSHYIPISFIHGVARILLNVIALRLAPHLHYLISQSQCAFIKKRSIHDNFMYVRNLSRRLYQSRIPALLLKLNITKAFDTVRWDYLLDLMQKKKKGFPTIWNNWITTILST